MAVQSSRVHDVVVIGAGHNGLVAANYLADAGLDVAVLEANEQIGGMSGSWCSIPEAPQHVINHCAVDPLFWFAYKPSQELGLERYGLRTVQADPAYAYLHPDGASLAVWHDVGKTVTEIKRFSPADAAAYREFADLLDKLFDLGIPISATNPMRPDRAAITAAVKGVATSRRQLGELVHLALSPAEDIIDERFVHPITRSLLSCFFSGQFPVGSMGTSLVFILLPFFHRMNCYRPVGGTGAIPAALAARLRDRNGTITTGAHVAEIVVRGDRATGVALIDGTVIDARKAVLASCDPKQALERLLPPGTLPARLEARARNIPTRQRGFGMIKIDVALAGQLDLSRFHAQRTDDLDLREPSHVIGTEEGLRRATQALSRGQMPDQGDIGSWNAIPTALDPTQAPAGCDTLYLWSQTAPFEPDAGWKDDSKDACAKVIVDRMAEFYGGLTELEIGRSVRTHADYAEWMHSTDGSLLHVDIALDRMGPFRPAWGFGGYKTPVNGLFIGSAGCHPGPGVTGVPGHNAAKEIIREARGSAMRRLAARVTRRSA